MASLTQIVKAKRRNKRRKQGRKRKNKLGKKSTPSYEEVFKQFGEPEK